MGTTSSAGYDIRRGEGVKRGLNQLKRKKQSEKGGQSLRKKKRVERKMATHVIVHCIQVLWAVSMHLKGPLDNLHPKSPGGRQGHGCCL